MLHIEVEFVVQEDSGNWCLLHLGKWSHRWSNWSQSDTSLRKKKENLLENCERISDSFFQLLTVRW